ncbi:MAG: hypothetical protein V3R84_10540 [Acidimicrobiia bacterium]
MRLPVLVGAVIVVVAFFSDGGFQVLGTVLIAGALIALLTLILGRLTVEVRPDHVRVAFGAGWPATTIRFDDIVSVAAVRNSRWYGWGIRWIPGDRLWNVWGLDAVELQLTTGRRFRIGTDEPDALLAALPALPAV